MEAFAGDWKVFRVVSEQVLGAQIAEDRAEGLVEFSGRAGKERTPAGAGGEHLERMLAGDVASGVVGNGNDDHRINDGLGQVPTEKPRASDLKNFASRDWLAGLLDPKQIETTHYFGATKFANPDPGNDF